MFLTITRRVQQELLSLPETMSSPLGFSGIRHLTVTRWVQQELLSLPETMSSPLGFSGIRLARSLVFCVVFCTSLLVL
jgi:hypothetical protein